MQYLSVCSGIEAATMAWHGLGWSPVAFSEIEKFPSAVLAHHYGSNMPGEKPTANGVPNYGDMTKFEEWPDHAIDLLVGGTPCQSFSVAGLRQGLADPRGNLMLTYLAIARRYQPRWLVWENVPGVLSSADGRDFGTFIRGLEECGYHAAWRVLDAQFVRVDGFERAVPQRRRRVFVVGYLGDWRRAASVLLEREGMQGDSAPRRETGEESAARTGFGVTGSVTHGYGAKLGTDESCQGSVIAFGWQNSASQGDSTSTEISPSLDKSKTPAVAQPIAIQERAISENAANGPDGVGVRQDGAAYTLEARQVPQAVAFAQNSRDEVRLQDGDGQIVGALAAEPGMKQTTYVAWSIMPQNSGKDYKARQVDVAQPIMAGGPVGGNQGGDYIQQQWAVRRLTPTECERLQGFPDGFTNIPWRGKPEAPDGPRYKALGNSMAVNCMRWLGERIDRVEKLTASKAEAA